jgi:hypothetical protein
MRKLAFQRLILMLLLLASVSYAQEEQESSLRKEQPPIPPEEIIRKFASKEEEFKKARDNYTYRQTARTEVLTADGRKTGQQWLQVSDILFDNRGRRVEKVLRAPVSTLHDIQLTQEDIEDIQTIYPFVLTTANIDKYVLAYLGKEKIDELDTYVFDVHPKKIEGDDRYFEGKIWVDDQDLQIVKTYGKTVYQITKKIRNQRFPRFETIRNQIDGKFWFPVWTKADDVLNFPDGQNVRVLEVVKWDNYKRFEAEVKITPVDEQPPAEQKKGPSK